jgi:hypothetical protein
MAKPFKGIINVDITRSTPDWAPYAQPVAPEGAPNVLYIVLDDVGFSAMEPFGGLIRTPNITESRNAGWCIRTSTRPRCVRRPGHVC